MDEELAKCEDPLLSAKHEKSRIFEDQSMHASISECGYASVMVGTGELYLGPFALFLKATNLQIGLLSSLPILLGAISQFLGVWLSEISPTRLKLIIRCVQVQASIWLPIALVYFLFGEGTVAVWILIALASTYFISGNLGAPAWNSLLGDLVPSDLRGRFFGYRNERSSIFMLLAMLSSGLILELASWLGSKASGFFALFMIAFIARMLSRHYFFKHGDPPYKVHAHSRFSYFQFLKKSTRSNFAKFVFFISSMSFGVMMSGPFFTVYMLNDLHFSYITYTFLSATVLMAMFCTNRYWGRLADKYGNKSILSLCAIGITLNPIMWLFTSSPTGIFFIQAYGGIVWGGYNLAAANFLFDAVTPPKRARCVAYQSITNATFIFLGTVCGAYLATHIPDSMPLSSGFSTPESPYIRIFLLSGILRAVTCYFLLPRFREVRQVTMIRRKDLVFQFIHLLPFVGTTVDYFLEGKRSKIK